jgi:hypothetical protein
MGAGSERSLTKDEMLDDITLCWLTNSANSSARLCWENNFSARHRGPRQAQHRRGSQNCSRAEQ